MQVQNQQTPLIINTLHLFYACIVKNVYNGYSLLAVLDKNEHIIHIESSPYAKHQENNMDIRALRSGVCYQMFDLRFNSNSRICRVLLNAPISVHMEDL